MRIITKKRVKRNNSRNAQSSRSQVVVILGLGDKRIMIVDVAGKERISNEAEQES